MRIFADSIIAENYLPTRGYLIIDQVFRVGRNSAKGDDPLEVNDLILQDKAPFNISGNHFSIEQSNGKVRVNDRGSFLGTIVNGKVIGGHHQREICDLNEGENEIIAGSLHSPFRFRVTVSTKLV